MSDHSSLLEHEQNSRKGFSKVKKKELELAEK